MNKRCKRIVIFASCDIVVAVGPVVISVDRRERDIVTDIDGRANHDYKAVVIVDDLRQTETVTLPKMFRSHARDVFCRISAADNSADDSISGQMYTENIWSDFSCN